MPPGLNTLKRGSVQLQKAAKVLVNDQIGSRQVLAAFVLTGFILCGIVEQSASVALRANSTSSYSVEEFAEYVENTSYITRYCQPLEGSSNESTYTIHVVRSIPHIEIPMTRTDETEGVLRQAFIWGTLVSPLAASRIAARVGAERLYGVGVLGTGVVAVLVPASWLTAGHVCVRIVQGIFMGATWPAAHVLAVTWIKPKNISAFVSLYSAVNLGYSVVGILGTILVRKLGRDWLSYIISLIAGLWYFLWWLFVEESLHPNRPKRDEHRNLPWRQLLASKPAWSCGVAVVGSQWADATLMLGVTKYLKLVYGFSIEYEDILQSMPHIGHFFAAITFGIVVDHIRSTGVVSTTTARKLFVYMSHFPPAALMFLLGYTGCDPAAPAALYVAALTMTGATPAGVFSSAADIAPNFAGTVFGLCQTVGAAGLLAANYAVSEGLHGSFAGWWRLVFGASTAILLSTAIFFMICGSGSVQHWNEPEEKEAIVELDDFEEPSRLDSVLE
ncbi:sialin-like [Anthonomus grandis grandis]|uniref:sialin-like n=1 Tax=Anthonomus grandis grandis TaxID=2921223 RepID=UPI0021665CDD|nr:sialin-like [Anthonomus grandis grandis]XP_050308841.1 sialin-like [Anthonomus grandis grandis]XP_050308842.1 sialin-like [Anthonomus grandis grandis]